MGAKIILILINKILIIILKIIFSFRIRFNNNYNNKEKFMKIFNNRIEILLLKRIIQNKSSLIIIYNNNSKELIKEFDLIKEMEKICNRIFNKIKIHFNLKNNKYKKM